ncbi:electron transport complex protein RnfC [bacterium BFN5]|nr:electron transport complex protein RnfC [bacterium BFN5]QJW46252.1 electron transport complex protein RnfC [bacterium BFN5]
MREEIIAAVRAAGVVGAGGAGFPTHTKINASVDVVIANGAECEPLLRTNQHLMAVESMKIVMGLKLVMSATGASYGYIGLKSKYEAAVTNLTAAIDRMKESAIKLFILPDFYPAGDEQVLVHEVTGRIVPEGGIPLNVGVVVANVETLMNVAQAMEGQAVTDKYVTVTGAVQHPVTLKVPVGLKLSELIALAGGPTIHPYAIIDGGPMMGKLTSPDAAVTKTTGGIILLPTDHSLVSQKETDWSAIANRAKAVCCNCMACTDVCPRHLLGHSLEPHRVMQVIGRSQFGDTDTVTRAFLCSECGACDTFGCSMGLSPRRVNAEFKRQLSKAGIKNPHHNKPAAAKSQREFRRIPTKRLVARLGLTQYDVKAPLQAEQLSVSAVELYLSQHIGAPAKPIVQVGDIVKRGDVVAEIPEGALGAKVHASIAGKVVSVNDRIGIRAV